LSQPGAVHDAVLQAEPLPAGAARAARAEVAAEYPRPRRAGARGPQRDGRALRDRESM